MLSPGLLVLVLAVVLDSPQLLRGALSLLFFACFVLLCFVPGRVSCRAWAKVASLFSPDSLFVPKLKLQP
jgi:hypothetical protein